MDYFPQLITLLGDLSILFVIAVCGYLFIASFVFIMESLSGMLRRKK